MINIWNYPLLLINSSMCRKSAQFNKSHFLLPDFRRRPMVEEKLRADLSHSERGVSVSASTSASAEETETDAEVEISSDASLVRLLSSCREVCGETERESAPLAWARGPACPSRSPFPSPCRWAWNVVVCCSTERKLSCTLSNCEREQRF